MKFLYILTFANGKQYVGQTSNWQGRWATHISEAVSRNAQQLVYRAWRKHGEPVFQHLAIRKISESNKRTKAKIQNAN